MAADTVRQPAQKQIELNKTFLNEDSSNDLNAAKGQNLIASMQMTHETMNGSTKTSEVKKEGTAETLTE